MENGNQRFLNKHCKLQRLDGFCLFGIPREITESYILYETPQNRSIRYMMFLYLSFSSMFSFVIPVLFILDRQK